jgi:hypothetical protein
MKIWTGVAAALVAGAVLGGGVAAAQNRPTGCDRSKTPDKVDAQVVKIDEAQGKITVRGADGTMREFQASKETLQDLKVGDRIEAKLRSAPNC